MRMLRTSAGQVYFVIVNVFFTRFRGRAVREKYNSQTIGLREQGWDLTLRKQKSKCSI